MGATREELMQRIWDAVPDVECKGLCQECCGPIMASGLEREMVEAAGGSLPMKADIYRELRDYQLTGVPVSDCPNLEDGRCSVYEVRPLICRLWGVAEKLPCPHGCIPSTGRHMMEPKARSLQARALSLGGPAL